MKKPLILSLCLLASVALADGLLLGSSGKGRLATADGRVGSFDYEAAKRVASNGTFKLSGRFRFEQQPNATGPYVLIELSSLAGLGVGGNVCEFSGHGILVTPVKGVRTKFGGTVSVRVVDRHDPVTGAGEADQFRVRFVGEKGLTFASEGLVREGDLVVATKTVK